MMKTIDTPPVQKIFNSLQNDPAARQRAEP